MESPGRETDIISPKYKDIVKTNGSRVSTYEMCGDNPFEKVD